MESHGRTRKVKKGQGRIIESAPVQFPFLWTLDFGLRFGTGLGLDNNF